MELSQETVKRIRELIVFAALVVVVLWKYEVVIKVLAFLWSIIFPFALGGAIAFVINVPMSFLERTIFGEKETRSKKKAKIARPLSLILTLLLVVLMIVVILFVLIPQLGETFASLGTNIAAFLPEMREWIAKFTHDNKEIMEWVNQIQYDPDKILSWAVGFVGNGAGNVMSTTVSAVGTLISGFTTFFIAFSFACYILFQKEKLHVQARKVMFAFLPKGRAEAALEICSLAYKTFSSFLTGQCVEALILGTMFVVTMSVTGLPYALLVGMVIAFTALIPVFGAFIGCGLGTLMIFIANPKQAIFFVVLFLVLQQIEGNLIYPHVVGGSVGLPSIWVLAAVSVGGNLMGVVGMLIFIPLASVIYALFREVVYLKLKQQGIKTVTVNEVETYTSEEVRKMREQFREEHAEVGNED